MSYQRSMPAERTVYLTLLDDPATTILFSEVTVRYKKQGGSVMVLKPITASDWINLGGGRYTLKFSESEMDTAGNFIFTIESPKADNFVYDEFQIEVASGSSSGGSGSTSVGLCRVYGVIRNISGTPMEKVRVTASPVNMPGRYNENILSGDIAWTITDSSGAFDLSLVRNSIVIFAVEKAGIRYQIEVPDVSDINLIDFLPAVS